MSRLITTFLITLVLISCKNGLVNSSITPQLDLQGYSLRKVKLINYCGTLSIYLPDKMDTAYQFVDPEDNACDDNVYFRFASKLYSIRTQYNSFPILNGKHVEPDSLYQVTIIQLENPCCIDEKSFKLDSNLAKKYSYVEIVKNGGNIKPNFMFRKINNRDFIVGHVSEKHFGANSGTNKHEEYIAVTLIDKQFIQIKFTAYKKDTTGFIAESEKSIQTLQVAPDTTITKIDVVKAMEKKGIDALIYGFYTEYAAGGFEANMKKMNKSCLVMAPNGDSFKYDENYGSKLNFIDTLNDYYYKRDKVLIDSIPYMLLGPEDKVFGNPDIKKHRALFLQIRMSNKIRTFHFEEDAKEIPGEIKNYIRLLDNN